MNYDDVIKQEGSIRKAAVKLQLTKSKLMVLWKKQLGLCTATTSCKNLPKLGCTRCLHHLRYAVETTDKKRARSYFKKFREANKEYLSNYHKKWQKDNKERANSNNRRYSKTEKGRIVNNAKSAYRRALQKAATPLWVDKKALKEVYKNCPKGSHVDHIIPLDNDLVCGLHVPWNLQILTAHENDSKGNKWDGTYENESWRKDLKKE